MAKRVICIETGVWWTKVVVEEIVKKAPQVHEMFSFRTPEHSVEDGYIRDRESFATRLKEELRTRRISEKNVIFMVNSTKVITREIEVPAVKDKQIPGIVEMQARDVFPMDISAYTIAYRKMEQQDGGDGKQMKLLLLAVPDNLLSNYVTFAEESGYEIEDFDYVGNSIVSFVNNFTSDDAVIVQLDAHETIISILTKKKLVFQRVTPNGYGTALSAVLDHPLLGARDEYEAFEFLEGHDVIYGRPRTDGSDEQQAEALEDAYADVREALSYQSRVVFTALEYYRNQSKDEFRGSLQIIGEGARISGIKRMFQDEIPLYFDDTDYGRLVRRVGNAAEHEVNVGDYAAAIGAPIAPIGIKPKELRERETKKNTVRSAYAIFFGAAAISVALIAVGMTRHILAQLEHDELQARIAALAPVQVIYNENEKTKIEAGQYQAFDDMTKTENERISELIASLEEQMPQNITAESLTVAGERITLNLISPDVITAAQFVRDLKEVPFLTGISIPTMSREENEAGAVAWQFSVLATYTEPPAEPEETEAAEGGASDSGDASEAEGSEEAAGAE